MVSVHHIFCITLSLSLSLSLSLEGQNHFYFDVLEQITQNIHIEKSLSDESEGFTFFENVFNGARRLFDMSNTGCSWNHLSSFFFS